METGDKAPTDGELSVSEMDVFLKPSSYGNFALWMLHNGHRNFRQFDLDQNGGIDMDELKPAIRAFKQDQKARETQ